MANGHTETLSLTMAEMWSMKQEGLIDVIPAATAEVRENAMRLVSDGFKDVLRDIKRRNPGSTITTV